MQFTARLYPAEQRYENEEWASIAVAKSIFSFNKGTSTMVDQLTREDMRKLCLASTQSAILPCIVFDRNFVGQEEDGVWTTDFIFFRSIVSEYHNGTFSYHQETHESEAELFWSSKRTGEVRLITKKAAIDAFFS